MEINGEVIAHGKTVHTLPQENAFVALCRRFDKYPFVFFNPRLFMIEERPAWVQTSENDLYWFLRKALGDAYIVKIYVLRHHDRRRIRSL